MGQTQRRPLHSHFRKERRKCKRELSNRQRSHLPQAHPGKDLKLHPPQQGREGRQGQRKEVLLTHPHAISLTLLIHHLDIITPANSGFVSGKEERSIVRRTVVRFNVELRVFELEVLLQRPIRPVAPVAVLVGTLVFSLDLFSSPAVPLTPPPRLAHPLFLLLRLLLALPAGESCHLRLHGANCTSAWAILAWIFAWVAVSLASSVLSLKAVR